MDFKNCIQKDLIQRVDIDAQFWEILRLFQYDALSEIKWLSGLRNLTLFLKRYEDGLQSLGEGYSRSKHLSFLGGRNLMLFEGHTTDREIAQCQWYVRTVKWDLDHGNEVWKFGIPSVQMWII